MLDRVRPVHRRRVDAGALEGLVQQLPGRADEGLARTVLLVAGLLADDDDGTVGRPIAHHGLACILVKRASAALLDRAAHGGDRQVLR